MFVTVKPRFQDKPLSKEVSDKIEKSYNETVDMKFRPIFCPYCDWHVVDVFDDIVGHREPAGPQGNALRMPGNDSLFRSAAFSDGHGENFGRE